MVSIKMAFPEVCGNILFPYVSVKHLLISYLHTIHLLSKPIYFRPSRDKQAQPQPPLPQNLIVFYFILDLTATKKISGLQKEY